MCTLTSRSLESLQSNTWYGLFKRFHFVIFFTFSLLLLFVLSLCIFSHFWSSCVTSYNSDNFFCFFVAVGLVDDSFQQVTANIAGVQDMGLLFPW